MSDKSDINALTKDGASQEALPSRSIAGDAVRAAGLGLKTAVPPKTGENSSVQTPQGHGVLPPPATKNANRPKILDLMPLPEEIRAAAESLRNSANQKILQGASEGVYKPGIYKEEGQTYWVLPISLFEGEENYLGAMIVDFAKIVGAEIRTISKPTQRTEAFDNDFIRGVWFGAFASTNQKRSRTKMSYEMGRTCMFALIVKNVFETNKYLGPAALARDNHFFGNNEKERSDKNAPVRFFIKTKLMSSFADSEIGQLIYGLVSSTAAAVGFDYLKEDEERQVYKCHIMPVNDLITSCYPMQTIVRKRRTEKVRKKPERPRSSKLLSSGEMSFINSICTAIWTDLVDLQADYLEQVYALGFTEVHRRIKDTIKLRWETLARFAHVTKERLQEIRKISNDQKIKKSTVLPEHLAAFIGSLQDPAANLVREVQHIIGHQSLQALTSFGFKKEFDDSKICHIFLYNEALKVYRKEYPEAPAITALAAKAFGVGDEPDDEEFEHLVKLVVATQNKLGNYRMTAAGLANVKEFKLHGRIHALEVLIVGLEGSIQSLQVYDLTTLEAVIYVLTNGKSTDGRVWMTDLFSDILSITRRIATAIALRSQDGLSHILLENMKSLNEKVTSFVKILDEAAASLTAPAVEG